MKKIEAAVLVALCLGVLLLAWPREAVKQEIASGEQALDTEPSLPLAETEEVVKTQSAELPLRKAADQDSRGQDAAQGAPGLDVVGRVVNEHGRGLGGASIWLSEKLEFDRGREVAQTDEEGNFQLRSVQPGRAICAFARGYVASEMRLLEKGPKSSLRVELLLSTPGVTVHGLVHDMRERPVANAQVLVGNRWVPSERRSLGPGGFHPDRPKRPPLWLSTDENGEFVAHGVGQRGTYIWVRAPGFAAFHKYYKLEETRGTVLRILLRKGATLVGRVVDEKNQPVAAAGLRVRDEQIDRDGYSWRTPDWAYTRGKSEADGSLRIEGMPIGKVRVEVSKGKLASSREFETLDEQIIRWDPVLGTGQPISGQVEDSQGVPLAGLELQALPPPQRKHEPKTLISQSDAYGAFTFMECREPWYTIQVRERGCHLVALPRVVSGSRDVRIVVPVDVRPTSHLSGTVRNINGAPLGTSVSADSFAYGRWMSAKSAARTGHFRIGPLPPGDYLVRVRVGPAHDKLAGPFHLAADQELDCGVIQINEPGSLRVRLTGAEQSGLRYGCLSLPDGHTWLAVKFRDGEGVAEELQPGDYLFHIGVWSRVAVVHRRVEIHSGQETLLELAVPKGVERRFKLLHPDIGTEVKIQQNWRDETGKLLWQSRSTWDRNAGPPFNLTKKLAAGKYRLEVISHAGYRGEVAINIEDLEPSDAVIEMTMEK